MKTSIKLRAVLAALESELEDAGKTLLDAEQTHRFATRRDLLNGTYSGSDQTAAAVETARKAQEQARIARDEAAGLLADAVARERAAEEAAIRDELRGMADGIVELAEETDAAFAVFVGKLNEAKQLEAAARRLSETGLHLPVFGGGTLPEAVSDFATFLRSLRTGAPGDLGPFAANRAAVGVQRIRAGAGL